MVLLQKQSNIDEIYILSKNEVVDRNEKLVNSPEIEHISNVAKQSIIETIH